MKKAILAVLLMLSLCGVAFAIRVSPETGEIIPEHVLTNPDYQELPASNETSSRDVGEWTGAGPWGGNVRSIITDPSNNLHVFAACGFNLATLVGGIFASTDGGINWQSTTLQGKPFYALAGSASETGIFYAGARNGLYKSTDNGATWNTAGTGMSSVFILSLGVKPNNGNTIVVGKSGGVGIVVSTDGGASFAQVGLNSGFMRQFAYSAANPERMFVVMGSSTSSVMTSINNGQSWSSYGPAGDGWGMYISPTDSLFSLIAHANGIFRTTDGGANWTQPISGTFRSVVEYNGVFYATSNSGGVYQSNDQGLTWQNYNIGVVQSTWQAGATSGAGALLGFWGGIFRSTGYQTPLVASHAGMNAAFVHGLACYSDTNELWAGAEGSGIYRSTDNGVTWEQRVNGLNSWMVYELVPTNHQYYQSGRMLAGTLNGVFTSIDGGNTWTLVDYQANQCTALEVHPTDSNKFWIGTSTGEIKYTDDGGSTWTVATGSQWGFAPRLKLGKGPLGGLRLFLSYQGSATAVWYSDNNGATFTSSTGMESTAYQTMVTVRPNLGMQPQIVYAASDLGVYKSTDNGASFALSGLTGFSWSVLNSPGAQVISGKENGLSYSTNEGQTSASLNQNLTNATVWQMAWGSSTNQVFIATRGKGVFENRFNDITYGLPTNLQAFAGDQQIDLNWNPVTTTPTPITYQIWRDGYPLAQTDTNLWTDTNLINGQIYKYCVIAIYDGNILTSPTEIIFATPATNPFPPPTDLTATWDGFMITLNWTGPDAPDLMGFKIYCNGTVLVETITNTMWVMLVTSPGVYNFYVTALYQNGGESIPSNVATVEIVGNDDAEQSATVSKIVSLSPNPFSAFTTINYRNAAKQNVEISIYNINGQKVKTLQNTTKQAGTYQTVWDGCDFKGKHVSTGMYFVKLTAGDKVTVKKAILVR